MDTATESIDRAEAVRDDPVVPLHVRRAVAWMREDLGRAVTLTGLADASGTTARTLHRQFRQFLGAPPMTWLRQQRLAAARHDMMNPARGPVTDVATRSGFTHLGRFATDYRKAFGERPSAVEGLGSLPGIGT